MSRTPHQDTWLCGCVVERLEGRAVTLCPLHTIGSMACCLKAKRLPCVCYQSYRCPEHGEQHIGSHE